MKTLIIALAAAAALAVPSAASAAEIAAPAGCDNVVECVTQAIACPIDDCTPDADVVCELLWGGTCEQEPQPGVNLDRVCELIWGEPCGKAELG